VSEGVAVVLDGRVAFIVQRMDRDLPAEEENVLCGQLLTKETQIGNKETRKKTERKLARWSCCELMLSCLMTILLRWPAHLIPVGSRRVPQQTVRSS
jgi:hypothetical protein